MDKDLLFKPRLPEAEVDIPGVGTVRVRGLSRIEAILVQKCDDIEARERKIISFGLVDPELSEHEAGRWQKASAASELESVTTVIANLSGLNADAAKEAYKSVRGTAGDGDGVLPGPEAGDDRGPDAGRAEQ